MKVGSAMDMGKALAPAIEVQHLEKRYPGAQANAVDDLSLTVQQGEVFGLLGPNGAGKTTTIGILTTRVHPTGGSALVSGIDVTADPIGVKQRISVVPQQNNLDQSLNAREILTFHARYHGIPHSEREKRADTLLQELGLFDRQRDMVRQFSGGMVQRLMVARALMHTPAVLFLDEPTHNLDPQSRLFLWDRLHALHQQNLTIMLTTHDMHEAEHLCDRIAIMDHGKILALGTAQQLQQLLPGGRCLELYVHIPQQTPADAHSQQAVPQLPWLEALHALPNVLKVEEITGEDDRKQDRVVLRLYAPEVDALVIPTLQILATSEVSLQHVRVVSASLEEVFIFLTGRDLRS